MNLRKFFSGLLNLIGLILLISACSTFEQNPWSEEEVSKLRTLWIGSLPPLPVDPSNQYADDPRAAALGQKLFFDTRFSSNGKVACGTCHAPDKFFQDGIPLSHGVGTTDRRAMTVIGTAYSPWFFWDGRKDSQWHRRWVRWKARWNMAATVHTTRILSINIIVRNTNRSLARCLT